MVTTPLGVVSVDKIFHDFPPEDPANDDHFIPMHSSIIDPAINNLRRRLFVLTANK